MPREIKESNTEWIGAIPSGWNTSILKNCLTEINDANNPIKTKNVLSLTNKLGVVPYEDKGNQGNKAKEDYSGYKLAYENTIVANSMNVLIGSVGISNYYGCVSPVYYVFKAKPNSDLRYINYIFQNTGFQKELRKYAKGIMEIRLRISSHDILRRTVPFPDKQTQTRIADYLDNICHSIDRTIADTEKSIEEYKKLRQSIITEAVTKGVRGKCEMVETEVEWIGTIPKTWNMTRMKNCVKARVSGAWGDDSKKDDGDIVCMRIADFDYDRLTFNNSGKYTIRNYDSKTIERLKLSDGDILIEKSGGGEKTPVGRAVVFNLGIDALYANFMDKIICKPEYNSRWLAYVFAAFYQNGFINNYIKQTTGIQNLDLTAMLSSEKIPVPTKDEQNEIVSMLDIKCKKINDLIDKKRKFIEELTHYRQSIIYEYVTGKKEVPEL